MVLGEKEQNKLNELSEKQLKEGLKNSGGKCPSTVPGRRDLTPTRLMHSHDNNSGGTGT